MSFARPVLDQLELRAHLDPSLEAPRDRAKPGVEAVYAFSLGVLISWDLEPVPDPDALYHEHFVLGLDLAGRLDLEFVPLNFDLTRLQRAGKSAC